MARLATAMPAAARAVSADTETPPQSSPSALLRRFVERMVDVLVRLGAQPARTLPAPTASRRGRQKTNFDSIYDQWIHSLQSDDPSMPSDGEERGRFAAQVREWHLPVSISASSPFRLCFRLEEPPEECNERESTGSGNRDAWQVRYLLQAVDDRSLLVEARDAWKTRKPAEAEQAMESAEGIQRKGLILAALSKLKQVCNHPAQFLGDNSAIEGRSGKLARLAEMIEEILEVGDRALVFSQFSEMGELLRRHLQETFGQEVLFLHGAVPKKRRDEMVERFQDAAGPRIFVLSLKAGGTGVVATVWGGTTELPASDSAFY